MTSTAPPITTQLIAPGVKARGKNYLDNVRDAMRLTVTGTHFVRDATAALSAVIARRLTATVKSALNGARTVRDIQVRYRDSAKGPLVLHNATDDEAIARNWANALWKQGKHEVLIQEIATTTIARKVRNEQ